MHYINIFVLIDIYLCFFLVIFVYSIFCIFGITKIYLNYIVV